MFGAQAPAVTVLAESAKFFAGAPDWLSREVLICGGAAIGLLVISLLLRGLQKLVSIALAIALVLGAVWFIRDAWKNKEKFLSPTVAAELDSLADKTLHSPQAQAAWASVKNQFSRLTSSSTERAGTASTDSQRREAVASELTTRAATLRREGNKAAADELLRFRDKLRP